eukprot:scaffold633510_cov39-Attheya_sp.AAC.1
MDEPFVLIRFKFPIMIPLPNDPSIQGPRFCIRIVRSIVLDVAVAMGSFEMPEFLIKRVPVHFSRFPKKSNIIEKLDSL